jgi:protein ImuB
LRLVPDGVLVHLGLQPGLWGDAGAERDRADRAFSRVQGLLGPEAVVTPVIGGGRSADDQVRLVVWGDERVAERVAAERTDPIPGVTTMPVLAMTADPVPIRPLMTLVPDTGGSVTAMRRPVDESAGDAPAPVRSLRLVETTPAPDPPAGTARPVLAAPAGEAAPADAAIPGPDAAIPGQEVPPGQEAAPGKEGRPGRRARRVVALPSWPGRLPPPSPAVVLSQALGAVVFDAAGTPVGVSARLEVTGDPAALAVENGPLVEITGWSGPWPVDERWWAPGESRRRARFQASVADGGAFLLVLSDGHWAVEAIYD